MNRILVFLPNWLGDVAMATPALRALHLAYPVARVSVAGRAAGCELVEGLPFIAERLAIPHRPRLHELLPLARKLAPYAADAALILPNSPRAAWLAWLAKAPRRAGLARNGRGLLLTDPVPLLRENGRRAVRYTALEFLRVAAVLGAKDDGAGLQLAANPDLSGRLRQALTGPGPLVGFVPGAAFGPSKQWLPERFAAVADRLHSAYGARCILLTGPGESQVAEAVQRAARTAFLPLPEPASVARLKAAIALCDLLISNDTGPRHIAVAFKRPVITIMGPTSPRYTDSPWEDGRVLRIDVDCGPCQKPHCTTDHRCMRGISADDVFAAAEPFLARYSAPGISYPVST